MSNRTRLVRFHKAEGRPLKSTRRPAEVADVIQRWHVVRNLDWPCFLRAFLFADLATLVIPSWELVLQLRDAPQPSAALEDLRESAMDARLEMMDLLNDAMGPTGV